MRHIHYIRDDRSDEKTSQYEYDFYVGDRDFRGDDEIETILFDGSVDTNGHSEDDNSLTTDLPIKAAKELVIALCDALGPEDTPEEAREILEI